MDMRPSLEPRLSVPDFVLQIFPQSCETKSGTEGLGLRPSRDAAKVKVHKGMYKYFDIPIRYGAVSR